MNSCQAFEAALFQTGLARLLWRLKTPIRPVKARLVTLHPWSSISQRSPMRTVFLTWASLADRRPWMQSYQPRLDWSDRGLEDYGFRKPPRLD
jgi:hypothetical protein